jgi:F-type H+-transporting ATPase subunit b
MEHHESFFADPRSWVAVAFVIFFVLFGKKIWVALTGILDKRAETIRGELAEAERLRAEAEAILKDADARRSVALAEAQALIDGAKREAARLAAEATAEAAAATTRRERMALDRISAAEKAAVDEVRFAAAEVASVAAHSVIAESLSPEVSAAILDRSIAQLPAELAGKAA